MQLGSCTKVASGMYRYVSIGVAYTNMYLYANWKVLFLNRGIVDLNKKLFGIKKKLMHTSSRNGGLPKKWSHC